VRPLAVSVAIALAAARLRAQERADAASGVSFIDDVAVVLEYASAYDVHSEPDGSTTSLRSQLGTFDTDRILSDLEAHVDPGAYDFVLLYSLRELPGWIHSGARNVTTPAKNVGADNCCYGAPPAHERWPRLRSVPHMNSVSYVAEAGMHHALHVAAHEMAHFWNVRWSRAAVGPREWRAGMPVGWLAGCCSHWTWNWIDEPGGDRLPGIMGSDPTSDRFNEFDLYAMGLMGYDEVRSVRHAVYECDPPGDAACTQGPAHSIGVDDLIAGLAASAPERVAGDGRRFPDTDPTMGAVRILVVVVEGADETLTDDAANLVRQLAAGMPAAWNAATRGRSTMSVAVIPPAGASCDSGGNRPCVIPISAVARHPIELAARP
jgi:hypothetical protein